MNFTRIKLTTDRPIERFKKLTPEMRKHTLILVDGNQFSYFCTRHDRYYELDESCSKCELEKNSTGEINMTRIKVSKTVAVKEDRPQRREWPAVVILWAFGLAVVSYAVARVVLDGKPHPYHWLAALIGGVAGILIGWLWYRWRGDLF